MNIVVLGGGTAGWLTAIYVQKTNPEANVTVIESEEIGILGAGEGSTSHLPHLLSALDVSIKDVIRHTGATIKNGIRFTGWNENRDFYFPFPAYAGLGEQAYRFPFGLSLKTNLSPAMAATVGHDVDQYDLVHKMSERNLIPMFDKGFSEPTDIIEGTNPVADWGLHFDARRLAVFLRSVAEERGVRRVEGIMVSADVDPDGYVTALVMKNDYRVDADFVFDASGFARAVIGKVMKAEWKTHTNHLPANRALPFFVPLDGAIPPYTNSVAMEAGWMWRIPTQDRFGCGYVFDSSRLSDDEAYREIEKYTGHQVESPKTFRFDAGCFKTPWVNNVLAVGLASGFLEPLEATSIWQTSKMLHRFLGDPSHLTTRNPSMRSAFNKMFLSETQRIVDFLYLHYVTKKSNSSFWRDFTKDNEMPETVAHILDVCRARPLYNEIDFESHAAFSAQDFSVIAVGNGLVSEQDMAAFQVPNREVNARAYQEVIGYQNNVLPMLLTTEKLIKLCAP